MVKTNPLYSPNIVFAAGLLLLMVGAAFIGPWLSPYSFDQISDKQLAPPSFEHWMGTDLHGRDLLTRVLYGARISIIVGVVGASVSLVIGVTYGIISGYVGGRVDNIMMRFVDILYSLPRIIIIIVLIAVFDVQIKSLIADIAPGWLVKYSRLILLFIGLGLVEWLTMARIIRGQVLALREQQFIQAAQVLGQSPFVIMIKHLLPNLSGIILVYLTLTIPAVILEESFLSFLGLGVEAPLASWGTLLANGTDFINPIRINWSLLAAPAIMMALTLLSLNFLGDGLRDIYDPRTSKSRS